MSSRRQSVHGANDSGAMRSGLGKVWATDFTPPPRDTARRTEAEEVEMAQRRAAIGSTVQVFPRSGCVSETVLHKVLHDLCRGDTEESRRQKRLELCEQFAIEVATWSSQKLRNCFAQPDAVARAEAREARAELEAELAELAEVSRILDLTPAEQAIDRATFESRANVVRGRIESGLTEAELENGYQQEEQQ